LCLSAFYAAERFAGGRARAVLSVCDPPVHHGVTHAPAQTAGEAGSASPKPCRCEYLLCSLCVPALVSAGLSGFARARMSCPRISKQAGGSSFAKPSTHTHAKCTPCTLRTRPTAATHIASHPMHPNPKPSTPNPNHNPNLKTLRSMSTALRLTPYTRQPTLANYCNALPLSPLCLVS